MKTKEIITYKQQRDELTILRNPLMLKNLLFYLYIFFIYSLGRMGGEEDNKSYNKKIKINCKIFTNKNKNIKR